MTSRRRRDEEDEQPEEEEPAGAEGQPEEEESPPPPPPTTFTVRADGGGYVELKSGRKFVGLLQAGAELTYPIEEKPDEA